MSNSTFALDSNMDSGCIIIRSIRTKRGAIVSSRKFFFNTDTNNCECYPNSNVVCNEQQEASLEFGYCMTYEDGEGTFLGVCGSFLAHGRIIFNRLYLDLSGNLTDLNDFMCGPMNRICSECIDGLRQLSLHLDISACSNCTESAW